MNSALYSIAGIYSFILIGFFLKKRFKSEIDSRTLTIVSVYGLQPILTFWGLTVRPIDFSLVVTPLLFFGIMLLATLFTVVLSKALYSSRDKKGTILASLSIIGNTGNLGIPLGLALFGVESLPYTSIINIANIFFIYTVSLFILAKDHYSPREAIRSIGSIPVIYVAVGAIFWNIEGFAISDEVLQVLQMGAYASIVIQLVIFGLYLSDIDSREFNIKLHLSVNLSKFLTLPLIGVAVIYLIGYEDRFESKVLIMELMMPLAVNSVNMATLYRSDPKSVTSLILSSSILFIALFLLFGSYL